MVIKCDRATKENGEMWTSRSACRGESESRKNKKKKRAEEEQNIRNIFIIILWFLWSGYYVIRIYFYVSFIQFKPPDVIATTGQFSVLL